MPQERLPKQALHAKANGRRPVGRPRTSWTDYIEDLGWNRLGLPRNPHGKAGNEERRRKKITVVRVYCINLGGIKLCIKILQIYSRSTATTIS